MFKCENCPALQYCDQAITNYDQQAAAADEIARVTEAQGMEIELLAVAVEVRAAQGELAPEDAWFIREQADATAASNQSPSVASTPLRGAFWRVEADNMRQQAADIREACTGLSSLSANLGHMVGKQVCGSTAPEGTMVQNLAASGYTHYPVVKGLEQVDPHDPLSDLK